MSDSSTPEFEYADEHLAHLSLDIRTTGLVTVSTRVRYGDVFIFAALLTAASDAFTEARGFGGVVKLSVTVVRQLHRRCGRTPCLLDDPVATYPIAQAGSMRVSQCSGKCAKGECQLKGLNKQRCCYTKEAVAKKTVKTVWCWAM